jgi:hypothetical protein
MYVECWHKIISSMARDFLQGNKLSYRVSEWRQTVWSKNGLQVLVRACGKTPAEIFLRFCKKVKLHLPTVPWRSLCISRTKDVLSWSNRQTEHLSKTSTSTRTRVHKVWFLLVVGVHLCYHLECTMGDKRRREEKCFSRGDFFYQVAILSWVNYRYLDSTHVAVQVP